MEARIRGIAAQVRRSAAAVAFAAAVLIAVVLPVGGAQASLGWDADEPGIIAGGSETAAVAADDSLSAAADIGPRQSCPGGLIHQYNALNGALTVYEFYSSADGGTNCAYAVKNVERGMESYVGIVLERCVTGNASNPCGNGDIDYERDYFEYYVGPVFLDNTANRCMMVTVYFYNDKAEHGPAHCG